MKHKCKRFLTMKKLFTAALLLLAVTPILAQGGATAISNAANDIKDYWDPIKLILKAVGGLVGFIAGCVSITNGPMATRMSTKRSWVMAEQ